ncbi:hypothetical protein A4X09_0g2101 [Tilletia walkeri]|uniref:Mitochondrial DNA polymerase catalytic subunit n=1 Tax=Tilletia walkeri TaxID=117179 RepID=A0A8X7NBI1_9BASI|nr:hypothetical protein A4X09_0g2101 [Tilletia walkeri]
MPWQHSRSFLSRAAEATRRRAALAQAEHARFYAAAAQLKVDEIEDGANHARAPEPAPRNPVGVQLLSRSLHAQVFPPLPPDYPQAKQPPPLTPEALSLSLAHLRTHGLDPGQAAVLNPTAFTLPQLQGANLSEHFWQLGREAAQPWLSMAEEFAALHQAPQTFSTTSEFGLLSAPSTGADYDAALAEQLEADDEDIGYLPPEDWLALDPSARALLHPRRPQWKWQSGWTMYPFLTTSSSDTDCDAAALGEGVSIPHPPRDDPALVFDVETLVNAGPWPVMATALGRKGWYAWLSPWLTGDSDSNEHLIPFGSGSGNETGVDNGPPRLIVGHNVGYDRARILDEYSIERPSIRYLDTMSLHVAIRGISSPQRPAYMKKRKERQAAAEALAKEERELKLMAKEEVKRILADTLGVETLSGGPGTNEEDTLLHLLDDDDTDRAAAEVHALFEVGEDSSNSSQSRSGAARAEAAAAVTSMLRELQAKRAEVAAATEAEGEGEAEPDSAGSSSSGLSPESVGSGDGTVQWHEVTSRNSLLEVAALHCNLHLNKDIRNTFVDPDSTVETLRKDWVNLLNYCAADTAATQSVLQAVLPVFRKQCPHPATFAGVLGMGSMILPVHAHQWKVYKETSEAIWKTMSDEVETSLKQRAEEVMRAGVRQRSQISGDSAVDYVEADPWLKQLDWSPKKPKQRRLKAGSDSESLSKVDPCTLDSATHIGVPKWYRAAASRSQGKGGLTFRSSLAHALLQLRYRKRYAIVKEDEWVAVRKTKKGKEVDRIGLGSSSPFAKAFPYKSDISSTSDIGQAALDALADGRDEDARDALERCAWDLVEALRCKKAEAGADGPLGHLDLQWEWVAVERIRLPYASAYKASASSQKQPLSTSAELSWWPKWYWDIVKMTRSSTDETVATSDTVGMDRGYHPFMDLSVRSRIAPLLLQLSWKGCPLFHSREFGWTYRQLPADVQAAGESASPNRRKPLVFKLEADQSLTDEARTEGAFFYKLPHASGEEANVGSPFSKSFMPYFENKTLQAGLNVEKTDDQGGSAKVPGSDAAQKAMSLNSECAYWVSARDRIMNQMVVQQGQAGAKISRDSTSGDATDNLAVILPQVITMGTITRRAIERTWLTASNAKKNRVGSELKSMVKAPPGWSIVGADVDSEELWICSVMGDAQFGMHGATAVGWMTLEGTKSLGTDLHSKTASILGTSRNQAKVFNYSRIYGAGIKHATQLMLKANPKLSTAEAADRAKALYRATKGLNTHRSEYFGRKFWHGGTESYVFNKLEAIALSENPQTPALDCGITAALSREYLPKADANAKTQDKARLGGDYMPSRINWVVQSSGVDYLHLLISSMEHLCKKYDIAARFMLSVHDEVRYLCREEDRYRTALALQVSNLWTRSMFAYKLEMDDLPQSCAFFAQVDIDHVLRKEVDDPCVTPSHPLPIPQGEALDIDVILGRTNFGSLHADGRPMPWEAPIPISQQPHAHPPYQPTYQQHRSIGPEGQYYLEAQATSDVNEIRALDKRAKVEEHMAREGHAVRAQTSHPPTPVGKGAAPEKMLRKSESASLRKQSSKPSKAEAEEAWLDQCAETAVEGKTSRTRKPSVKRTKAWASTAARPKVSSHPLSAKAQYSTAVDRPAVATLDIKGSYLKEIQDLAALIPSRIAIRGPGRPFYLLREHRMKVLWGLYRPILRLCPPQCMTLRAYLKSRFKTKKRLVTRIQTNMLIEQAEWWLALLRRSAVGDVKALKQVERQDRKLKKQAVRRGYREQDRRFETQWINPPPIPHISGAILRPTKDNPPLPRYKPVQPEAVTMMINRRRRQRTRLFDHLKDVIHLKDSIASDRQAERDYLPQAGADRPTYAGADGWDEFISSEMSRVRNVEKRAKERENMMVPEKILRKATSARRARTRVIEMLKLREDKDRKQRQHAMDTVLPSDPMRRNWWR